MVESKLRSRDIAATQMVDICIPAEYLISYSLSCMRTYFVGRYSYILAMVAQRSASLDLTFIRDVIQLTIEYVWNI